MLCRLSAASLRRETHSCVTLSSPSSRMTKVTKSVAQQRRHPTRSRKRFGGLGLLLSWAGVGMQEKGVVGFTTCEWKG